MRRYLPTAVIFLLLSSCGVSPSNSQSPTGQTFNSVPRSQFSTLLACVVSKDPNALGSSPGQAINLSNSVSDADWQNPGKLGPYAVVFQNAFDLARRLGCI